MLRRTRNRLLSIMIMNGVSVATLLPWRRGHCQRSHLHHFCVVSPLCERPPRQPRYLCSRHLRQVFRGMAEIAKAPWFKWPNGMRRKASHAWGLRLFDLFRGGSLGRGFRRTIGDGGRKNIMVKLMSVVMKMSGGKRVVNERMHGHTSVWSFGGRVFLCRART